jgi:hypothetical protein
MDNPAGRGSGIRGRNNRCGREHRLVCEILGVATGTSEAEPFWTEFLRS